MIKAEEEEPLDLCAYESLLAIAYTYSGIIATMTVEQGIVQIIFIINCSIFEMGD